MTQCALINIPQKLPFLPHIVQILNDLRLINEKSKAVTDDISDKKIKINYSGKYTITAESDLTLLNKEEYLKIFLKNKKIRLLSLIFSGISGPYGFVKYPSITVYGKETQICEDILKR